ncbi:MAG: nucleotide exchange factor GrpE [Bacteroidota bacterium]|nr:nucleotide exchange factor GrpE [Bacteroidota bacterium]
MSESTLNENNQSKESKAEEELKEKQEVNGTDIAPEAEQESEEGLKESKHKAHKESKAGKLEEELANLNDKYLRLYSEFDNYKKRTIREKIEMSKMANASLILSMLTVVDDLERAISAFDHENNSQQGYYDGLVLILNKFMSILSQNGLEPIKSVGEVFNTDFHEAITLIPSPEPDKKGKVIDEILKGYTLNGKVIRFSKVIVGN